MRRELGRKPLNSAIDFEPIVALGGLDEQNSLYFPTRGVMGWDGISRHPSRAGFVTNLKLSEQTNEMSKRANAAQATCGKGNLDYD